MAVRLRCTGCDKKISVDDAFAGSMCRCPYCKAIVAVPGGAEVPARRPAVPARRPASPVEDEAPAQGGKRPVVMARPVRLQGILALVLLAAVVLMAAGAALVLVRYGPELFQKQQPAREPAPDEAQDEAPEEAGAGDARPQPGQPVIVDDDSDDGVVRTGPRVMGMRVASPVAYCVGLGGWSLDTARAEMLESIETLDEAARFTVVWSDYEGDVAVMPGGYRPSDAEGASAARQFVERRASAHGLADAVVRAAKLDPPPKTIVVFAGSPMSDEDIERCRNAAAEAGAEIVVGILAPHAAENLQRLATDGTYRVRHAGGF
ncbi:MAG: hypothetical protein ACOC8F_06725 [Planctomycetota bacterium]